MTQIEKLNNLIKKVLKEEVDEYKKFVTSDGTKKTLTPDQKKEMEKAKAGETIEKGAEKFKELSIKYTPKFGKEQKYKGMNLTPILIDKYFEEGTVDPLAGSSNQRVGQPTIIEPAENISKLTQKIIGKTAKFIAKDIAWDGSKWIIKKSKETYYGEPEYYRLQKLKKEAK